MAGIAPYFESDPVNKRMVVGWTAGGLVHRTNILLPGGSRIELHRHSYDHTFKVKSGTYSLTDINPAGDEITSVVRAGDELLMLAWHYHAFDRIDGGSDPGVIDCFWPEGADQ